MRIELITNSSIMLAFSSDIVTLTLLLNNKDWQIPSPSNLNTLDITSLNPFTMFFSLLERITPCNCLTIQSTIEYTHIEDRITLQAFYILFSLATLKRQVSKDSSVPSFNNYSSTSKIDRNCLPSILITIKGHKASSICLLIPCK